MSKMQCMAEVIESKKLQSGIYSLWLEAPEIAAQAGAGQFVSLYCKNQDHLLPRPISLCEIDRAGGKLRLVYRVVGAGTEEFSNLQSGDKIKVLGPLGNGFEKLDAQNAIVIGGGIGIPPLLQLTRELKGKVTAVVGYRDSNTFLLEELKAAADCVVIATEDGSIGTRGNVIDAVRQNGIEGDCVFSCGPIPMLRGVKEWSKEKEIPAFLSLEEKMACGLGACLACVCQSTDTDAHSKVKNKRICKDGPVFLATEIEL